VTPLTDLAGGVAPEILASGVRWRYGSAPWQAGVMQKVVLEPGSPPGSVDATEIDAVPVVIGSATAQALIATHVVYPEAGGPGFVFGIGLPVAGCWALTAVGPDVRSSIVVEAGPPPANPLDPTSQAVPTGTAPPATTPAACPVSPSPLTVEPQVSPTAWLDGSTTWTVSPTTWRSGQVMSVILAGGTIDGSVLGLTAVAVGLSSSTSPAYLEDGRALTSTEPGQRAGPFALALPRPGCWAITAFGPSSTSTVVVQIASATRSPAPPPTPTAIDEGGTFGTSGLWATRGSHLYLSTDYGTTWVQRSLGTGVLQGVAERVLTSVFVLDAAHVWSATPGPGSTPYDGQGQPYDRLHVVVSRTVDGGRTWRSVTLPGDWGGTEPVLAFADARHGYLLLAFLRGGGPGAVFATADGGATWKQVSGPESLGSVFSASDAQTLWAGNQGDAGPVSRPILDVSRDGGKTWADARLPGLIGDVYVNDTPVAPPMFAGQDGAIAVIAASTDTFPIARFYRTSDGGRTWLLATQVLMGENGTDGVAVIDPLHFLAIDPVSGRLQATSDGGATWQASPTHGFAGAGWLRFWDPAHGVAMSQAGADPSATGLFTTGDGGQTWSPVSVAGP
jgi:hypothetical protein